MQCTSYSSSVARGGARAPPLAWKVCKTTLFGAFEAQFCSKNENSPPKGIWEPKLWRSCRAADRRILEIWEFRWRSAEKYVSISVKTFFFFLEITRFLAEKNLWIWDFAQKIRLNFAYSFLNLPKTPPHINEILATRLSYIRVLVHLTFWAIFWYKKMRLILE